MLTVYESLPKGILECDASDLHRILPGPSLIHLTGEKKQPLFVSVLLHGNETTGWYAVRELLTQYRDKRLPRSLSLFIANIEAARYGKRHLEHQPDFNRIWKLDEQHDEIEMVHEVMRQMEHRDVFACVDIHNNSGRNPHYACVNRLTSPFFQLAKLFADTVVYFIKPDTVLSLAFANLCPAVTIECGKPEDGNGVQHALNYLQSVLGLDEFDEHSQDVRDIRVFHTVAIVKLKRGISIGLQGENTSIEVSHELDQMNFTELPPGTCIARTHLDEFMPIEVLNEFGRDVAEKYFRVKDGALILITEAMPSMLTLDMDIVQQDCLCYLMERLDLSTSLSA